MRCEDVYRIWGRVQPHVENALSRDGGMSAHDVLCRLVEGRWLLFVVLSGDDIVASLVVFKNELQRKTALEVLTAGGERFHGWSGLVQAELERMAADLECDCIRATCRPGMTKWLENIGYKSRQTIVEYPINVR